MNINVVTCAGLIFGFMLLVRPTFSETSVNVKTFGAKADGKTDDAPAIQKALDSLKDKGGIVELPAGTYALHQSITIPSGVTLRGVWRAPHHAQIGKGTVFNVYAGQGKDDGSALVNLSPSSAIEGITFFYPDQRIPNPYPYPWTIQGSGMHCSVMNVTLVNAYKGIDFGTHHNELHYVRNVFGCPLRVGVYIDQCTDIGRVENVHFNPHFWMRAGTKNVPSWNDLRNYLFENCVAFEIGRSDWEFIFNTFSFGCKIGYRFFKSKYGACNGNFLGIAADWAETALLVEDSQTPGLLITNGEFVGGEGAETMILVAPTHTGVVQLSNCSFWGPSERIAVVEGRGTVSFSQCNFCDWDYSRKGYAAVEARQGHMIMQGCRFGRGHENSKHILLAKELASAIIMGNQFGRKRRIENLSEGNIEMGLNVDTHVELKRPSKKK